MVVFGGRASATSQRVLGISLDPAQRRRGSTPASMSKRKGESLKPPPNEAKSPIQEPTPPAREAMRQPSPAPGTQPADKRSLLPGGDQMNPPRRPLIIQRGVDEDRTSRNQLNCAKTYPGSKQGEKRRHMRTTHPKNTFLRPGGRTLWLAGLTEVKEVDSNKIATATIEAEPCGAARHP